MAYFTVTGTDNSVAIINGNQVSKVVDFGSYRVIYQGSDINNYQVVNSLADILNLLQQ